MLLPKRTKFRKPQKGRNKNDLQTNCREGEKDPPHNVPKRGPPNT